MSEEQTPQQSQPNNPPATEGQAAPAPAQAPTSDVQQRIDALVKRQSETQNNLQAANTQNEQLLQQVLQLSQKVDSLQGAPAQPAGPTQSDPLADFLAAPKPAKTASPAPNDFANVLRQVVQQEIAPVVNEIKGAREQDALRQSQEQAFDSASKVYPDLLQQNSELRQVFNQVWDGRTDLHGIPDAPHLVANIAQGIVSTSRRTDREVEGRKQAANISRTPNSGRLEIPSDSDKAKELVNKLTDEGSVKGWNEADELGYMALKLGRAVEKEQ
jgi:hypothetical protein